MFDKLNKILEDNGIEIESIDNNNVIHSYCKEEEWEAFKALRDAGIKCKWIEDFENVAYCQLLEV